MYRRLLPFLSLLLLSGCASAMTPFTDVDVTGKVIDGNTGDPIGNVVVATEQLSAYSDFDGTFVLEGRMYDVDTITFTFHKKGYSDFETTVSVATTKVNLGTVNLSPVKTP